jgi:hypothetical protein
VGGMKRILLILTMLVTVVSCSYAANLTMYGLVNREAKMDGKVDFYCINNAFVEMKKQKIADYRLPYGEYKPNNDSNRTKNIIRFVSSYTYEINNYKQTYFELRVVYENGQSVLKHMVLDSNVEKRKTMPEKILPTVLIIEKILNNKCSVPTFEDVKN